MDSGQTSTRKMERGYEPYNIYKQRPEGHPTGSTSFPKGTVYNMNDQTFHTPSFGDEEFNIPTMHSQHATSMGQSGQNSHITYSQMHHAVPQVGMMNPAQDGLAPPGGVPSYQQPLYLQEPHTPVTTHSAAGAPAGNYIIQQQPGGQQRLLMMQPGGQTQVLNGPSTTPGAPAQAAAPVYSSPQRASPPGTTSDDSDDSVPSHHSQLPGDAESLLPIHYCSASRQQQSAHHQIGVSNNLTMKRSSPEPIDNGVNRGQMQKKPKVQKKKKKRDPNEPQKPVSAYALFFRDTQAAIKGQNPNASFGEVSKIVASMWDGLDSDHKNVYKQKTEVAKKEYLKALAAYRASLVSKGGEQETPAMYNHNNNPAPSYGNYYQGQPYGNGHSPQGYGPAATPQGYSPQSYQGNQTAAAYTGQPQGYPPNPQQSPQNFQPVPMNHPPQAYQNLPGQSPQSYQNNPSSSPTGCPPNIAQSPRNYQNTQSPPNYANAGLSPTGYRQIQSQSPPMGAVHTAMYHHQTQMTQNHQQVHQYQQQSQQQMQQAQQQLQQHQHLQQNHQQQMHQMQQNQQQMQQSQQQMQQSQQQMQQSQQLQQSQQQMQQSQQQLQHSQQPMQQSQQPLQQSQHQNIQQQQLQQTPPPTQMQHQQMQQQPQHQQLQQQTQQQLSPKKEIIEEQPPMTNGNPATKQSPQTENRGSTSCIRQGCTNPAVANSEWEDEYCSNECVVSHCRDVFSSWVASNSNQIQNFSAVK